MKNWLSFGSKEDLTDGAFMGEQVLVDLFIRYNTAIPSTAAVERLFFIGKDILTAKRAKLSDANFERLMFMKGNHNIMLPGCRRKRLPRDATLLLIVLEYF